MAVRARILSMLSGISLLAPGACIHSTEAEIQLAKSPEEDGDYDKALSQATQKRIVNENFETRYDVTATYLSPQFRVAFAKRLEKVFKKGDIQLDEATQKAGFIVSLHTLIDDRSDLTNPHHWTVLLHAKNGESPIRPLVIKPLSDKERWRAFFPAIDFWSADFLVIFDSPSTDAKAANLVEKSPVKLSFSNADATVEMTW